MQTSLRSTLTLGSGEHLFRIRQKRGGTVRISPLSVVGDVSLSGTSTSTATNSGSIVLSGISISIQTISQSISTVSALLSVRFALSSISLSRSTDVALLFTRMHLGTLSNCIASEIPALITEVDRELAGISQALSSETTSIDVNISLSSISNNLTIATASLTIPSIVQLSLRSNAIAEDIVSISITQVLETISRVRSIIVSSLVLENISSTPTTTADKLVQKYGRNIELRVYVAVGGVPADPPWRPPNSTLNTLEIKGVVTKFNDEFVDNKDILQNDLKVLISPLDLVRIPTVKDSVRIDNNIYQIIKVTKIEKNGITQLYSLQVR